MARLIAPRLAEALGQPVVVDNKPGASGTIAAAQIARAAPDGSTLLLDASSFAANPALFDKLPYDSASAFVPLAVLALFPDVLGLHAGLRGEVPRRRAAPGARAARRGGLRVFGQRLGPAPRRRAVRVAGPGAAVAHPLPRRRPGAQRRDGRPEVPLFFANVASSARYTSAPGRLRPLAAVTSKLRARVLPERPRWTRPA